VEDETMKTKAFNLSTFVILIFLTLAIVILFNTIVSDLKTQYPSVNVNESDWGYLSGNDTKYSDINRSVNQIQGSLQNISDASGWQVFAEGAAAIPIFLIQLPALIINSLLFVYDIFNDLLITFGLPKAAAPFFLFILLILVIFGIYKFFNKTSEV
jgi:archaellum biogenesis protein FlaJ (TadC family)